MSSSAVVVAFRSTFRSSSFLPLFCSRVTHVLSLSSSLNLYLVRVITLLSLDLSFSLPFPFSEASLAFFVSSLSRSRFSFRVSLAFLLLAFGFVCLALLHFGRLETLNIHIAVSHHWRGEGGGRKRDLRQARRFVFPFLAPSEKGTQEFVVL